MGVPVVGMVLVESSWVRQTGMSALFERVPESKAPSGDVRIIFVTSYNIFDSTFAEIVFYPRRNDQRAAEVTHVGRLEECRHSERLRRVTYTHIGCFRHGRVV